MKIKYLAIIGYLASIPAANWMINNVGTQGFPGGPHTIPVGFGYSAPSGVLMIGIALVLRDSVQNMFGKKATLVAIAIGIGLSAIINPNVALASAVAFAFSELADFFVYTEVKKKTLVGAVVLSGIIGGVIDSFLFLQIAFDSIKFWEGQIIGKTMMALLGGLLIYLINVVPQRLSSVKA